MKADQVVSWLGSLDGEEVTDLHLKPGSSPKLRRKGEIEVLEQAPALTRSDVDELAEAILTEAAAHVFATRGEASCTWSVSGLGRFRVRAQRQRGSTLLVVRRTPDSVPSLRELELPPAVEDLLDAEQGILLVGGPPHSGRRLSLASMIDHLNRTRAAHIVSIELPVQVLHRDARSSVSQLEVGLDAPTFGAGVRAAIASDGDVIGVSDVDDGDTVEAILEAVEDGALVLAGVDGDGAAQLLDRFVHLLPAERCEAAGVALVGALVGTVSQRLARRAGNTGRVPVVEVVRGTGPVRASLLDEASMASIDSLADISFDDALATLVERGVVDLSGALAVSTDWGALHTLMRERGLLDALVDDAMLEDALEVEGSPPPEDCEEE